MNSFENLLINELTDRTGHRVPRRNILAWSLDRNWLDTIKAPDEEEIFLPGLEVWVLVRNDQNKRNAA